MARYCDDDVDERNTSHGYLLQVKSRLMELSTGDSIFLYNLSQVMELPPEIQELVQEPGSNRGRGRSNIPVALGRYHTELVDQINQERENWSDPSREPVLTYPDCD